ncbi:MAG: MASE4 domain-containing protein [Hyphomicrobiales bacterium]|nr:MASE4 domain-containing protein [Hyphomicrobiales bacterium]
MADNVARVEDAPYLTLASLPPGARQERLALTVVIAIVIALVASAGPLAAIPMKDGSVAAALIIPTSMTEAMTAVLLYAQFSILGSPALLTLATGYLFTSLYLIVWLFTLPGVFAPSGLLGATPQSAFWLAGVWHTAFSISVIAFALLKDEDPSKWEAQRSRGGAIAACVAVVVAVACGATFLLIAGDELLPPLMRDESHASPFLFYRTGATTALSVVALVVLWLKRRSVLDLWLLVVMSAYAAGGVVIAAYSPDRNLLVWQAVRASELLAGSLILIVLLVEISALYGELLNALLAQRREREARLITGDAVTATIAHEIKQPLTAMLINVSASLHWLERPTPDFDEARRAMKQAASNGERVSAVVDSIRSLFKRDVHNRSSFDVRALLQDAVRLLRAELQKHCVTAEIAPLAAPLQVMGDRAQLRQVLLNLMTNAIEAMANTPGPRILSVSAEATEGSVLISVADSGPGIQGKDIDWVFKPLLTTKRQGMGIGLTISRSIVEAHGGRLWARSNSARGAIFQFTLPAEVTKPGVSRAPRAARETLGRV